MKYGWRRFSFDLPNDLEDQSVLAFLERKGDEVDVNVTLTAAKLEGSLDAYLAAAVDEVSKSLSGYKLIGKTERKVAGQDVQVLEHSATSPEGKTLCLLQAYIPDGDDVAIVTATGNGDSRARVEELFEGFVGSMRSA